MAFGLSGSQDRSQMEGADATIAFMDGARGYANDYNITAKAPVSAILLKERFNWNSLKAYILM